MKACPVFVSCLLIHSACTITDLDTSFTAGSCLQTVVAGQSEGSCAGLTYDLSVPAACVAGGCGVVFDLHGKTMNSDMQDQNTSMREIGGRAGYIVVQPNGSVEAGQTSWTDADKTALKGMVDSLVVDLKANPNRVHMMGYSMGGSIALQFLCEGSTTFASMAPMAAAERDATCSPAFPKAMKGCNPAPGATLPNVHLLLVHGTQDGRVPTACATRQRDALLATYGQASSAPVASDVGYRTTRYQTLLGPMIEYLEFDYASTNPNLVGHCFPGSTDPGTAPGQMLSYRCDGENRMHYGQAAMAFFLATGR